MTTREKLANGLHDELEEIDYLTEHKHDWYPLEITDDQPEQIYWCNHCDASKDSDGGII